MMSGMTAVLRHHAFHGDQSFARSQLVVVRVALAHVAAKARTTAVDKSRAGILRPNLYNTAARVQIEVARAGVHASL